MPKVNRLTTEERDSVNYAIEWTIRDMQERETFWLELSKEVEEDGTPKYPNAARNLEWLRQEISQLMNAKPKLRYE